MRDRGEQCRSQPLGFDGAFDADHILNQVHSFDGERCLIGKRVEKSALIGRQKRSRLIAVDADHAHQPTSGSHRQEKTLRSGERVRSTPRSAVVLPGPFRRGEIGFIEDILWRIAGLYGNRAVLGEE